MTASSVRHETRALLRAHLSAASGYRHVTRHCPVCSRLLRLAMELSEPEPLLVLPDALPAPLPEPLREALPEPLPGDESPAER
ncbi:DUF6274 family protein [Streptomyces sp. NBC_00648]|uniref:DUF6274 family protein n=1 Tax=Streptomyces sp. NBC_00648 TaxID=2975797 RepID=UPI00324F649F